MRAIRDGLTHAVLGVVGLVFGAVSALALAFAAAASALLGLLAFVFSPLRGVIDRLRP